MTKKTSLDLQHKAALLYTQEKLSSSQVAALLHLSDATVRNLVRREGLFIRDTRACRRRKHYFNTSFFDQVNSEAKAYFFGFLLADGSNNGRNAIEVEVQERDGYILETFLEELNSENLFLQRRPAAQPTHQPLVHLLLSSTYMSKHLEKLGMVPRKSYLLVFPDWIKNSSLLPHFLRGYWDGDGNLQAYERGYRKDNSRHAACSVVGTDNFCSTVRDLIYKHTGTWGNLKHLNTQSNCTSTLVYGGIPRAFAVAEWLYGEGTIYLKRKFQIYQQIREFKGV